MYLFLNCRYLLDNTYIFTSAVVYITLSLIYKNLKNKTNKQNYKDRIY